uniref:VHS domain-containing protein n=1 Tax=Hippocampus comes TaxID=109280 RepID=A0A3Q3E773_HIPCM
MCCTPEPAGLLLATDPSNRQEDWECITGFCDQINKELEGPQIAARLLVHKVHSPQEWEALQALMVLEACMKNCGQRFQNEVGKFRFLNELIKVISPKVSTLNTFNDLS